MFQISSCVVVSKWELIYIDSFVFFLWQGTNLTLAYVSGDVTVTIGEEECLNIFLTGDTLRCDAPLKQPNSITGGELPYVTVSLPIGSALTWILNSLGISWFTMQLAMPFQQCFKSNALQTMWSDPEVGCDYFFRRPQDIFRLPDSLVMSCSWVEERSNKFLGSILRDGDWYKPPVRTTRMRTFFLFWTYFIIQLKRNLFVCYKLLWLVVIFQVHHGSIVTTIGQVQYLEEELPLYIIFIAVAIGVIIIIFFFCLCTVYRRNATKNERKVKHLLQERDRLELQVAMECKEGKMITRQPAIQPASQSTLMINVLTLFFLIFLPPCISPLLVCIANIFVLFFLSLCWATDQHEPLQQGCWGHTISGLPAICHKNAFPRQVRSSSSEWTYG